MFKITFDAWNNQVFLLDYLYHPKSYHTSQKVNKILRELYYSNKERLIILNIPEIAKTIERDPKTVRRYIKEAENRGYLSRSKEKHKLLQITIFNVPVEETLVEAKIRYVKDELQLFIKKVNHDLVSFKTYNNVAS